MGGRAKVTTGEPTAPALTTLVTLTPVGATGLPTVTGTVGPEVAVLGVLVMGTAGV